MNYISNQKSAVKPLSPADVVKRSSQTFPPEVIECFNQLILEKWNGTQAQVNQKEALERISQVLKTTTQNILDSGYLDIETAFRKVGWSVRYEKGDYSSDAFFIFKSLS